MLKNQYSRCELCARACRVDRTEGGRGYCDSSNVPHVARVGLHEWEEPIISGTRGSGTIFFSSCSLKCVFCQNADISRREVGRAMTDTEIAESMLSLQSLGAHNVNFVTPTHFAPSIVNSIDIARSRGLVIPTVYNTSSYDTRETVRSLDGSIDVFIPDLKYYLAKSAKAYSKAENYVEVAKAAIDEMVRLAPRPVIEDGIMKKGVIVRILLLPAHVAEAKLSLEYIYKTYGDNVYVSLMSQYTPMPGVPKELARRVSVQEYGDLVRYAEKLGVTNAFTQDFSSVGTEYIPTFDVK